MTRRPTPRLLVAIFLLFLTILLLATTHYSVYAGTTIQKVTLSLFSSDTSPPEPSTSTEDGKAKDGKAKDEPAPEVKADKPAETKEADKPFKSDKPATETVPDLEKGDGGLGKHFHVRPSPSNTSAKSDRFEYPIVVHVTPDVHCTGTLTTYTSVVQNVFTAAGCPAE
jgi:hypothetical protein